MHRSVIDPSLIAPNGYLHAGFRFYAGFPVHAGFPAHAGFRVHADFRVHTGFRQQAVRNGTVSRATLDTTVCRAPTQMFASGLIDHAPSGYPTATVTTPVHAAVAPRGAEEGTVLLQTPASGRCPRPVSRRSR